MQRFFGMMPSSEIEREERFRDKDNIKLETTIQAGQNGWTIIYADDGTNYKDIVRTTDENFDEAYKVAVENLGELIKVESSSYDVVEG